ncbi:MAG: ABC transporter permease subunit, partial [Anaerolineae bacterium]|nr:ABC transporter permease subunit [Anaerolineae bacterium]
MANSKRLASLSQPQTNPFNLVGVETQFPSSPDRNLGRRLRRNQGAILGLFIVTIMGLLALCAPVLAGHDPAQQYSGRKLEGPSVEFPLGTDQLNRDLFSRLVYGARPSLGLAALATVLICLVGVSVGVVSGYVGGWLDDLLMRLVDVFLALPGLLLALAIIGILGPGLENVILGVILVSWAGYARLVRGLVL